MKTDENNKIRYNIMLPKELYDSLKDLADEQDTTISNLMRSFIKLGMIALAPDTTLVLKTRDSEQQIVLL